VIWTNHYSGKPHTDYALSLKRTFHGMFEPIWKCELVAPQRSDLIVLSTHGHTGLDRYLIGSVADRVARLAPCPVFLMRPGKPSRGRKRIRPSVLRFRHKS
jgi:hypothetical protein